MIKRWNQRKGMRGVAMVEGGILAPIFAMMMMLNIYLGGVYQTKYLGNPDQLGGYAGGFLNERFQTWSFASNHCTADEGGSGDNTESATKDQSGNVPKSGGPDSYSGQVPNSGSTASAFIGHGQDTSVWSYQPTLMFNGGQPKVILTEGWVVCNEPPNQGYNIIGELKSSIGQAFGKIPSI